MNDCDVVIRKKEDRLFLKKLSRYLSYSLLLMTVSQSIFNMFLILLGFNNGKSSIGETFKLLFSYFLILIILVKSLKIDFLKSLKFKKTTQNSLYIYFGIFGLFCSVSLILVMSCILNIFNIEALESELIVPESLLHIILFFLNVVVLPGIFEEVIFRGIILELLRKNGDIFCIVISSLLACLCCKTLCEVTFIFVLSLFLGFIKVKTESLLPGILVRCISNGYVAIVPVLKNFCSDDKIRTVKIFMYFGIMIIGTFGILVLTINKKNFYRLKQSETSLNFWQSLLIILCSFGMMCFIFNTAVNVWVSNNILHNENSDNETLSYVYEKLDESDIIAVKGSGGNFDSNLLIYRYKFNDECLTEVSCQLIFNNTDKAKKQFLKIKKECQDKYSDISIDRSVIQFYFSNDYLLKDYQGFSKSALIDMIQKGQLAE